MPTEIPTPTPIPDDMDAFDINKVNIFRRLSELNVGRVTVDFDGSYDDGQLNDWIVENADGTSMDKSLILNSVMSTRFVRSRSLYSTPAPDATLMEQMEEICYDILEHNELGWELEDGSYGEFIFEVESDTILLAYNERFTDSRLTTAEF